MMKTISILPRISSIPLVSFASARNRMIVLGISLILSACQNYAVMPSTQGSSVIQPPAGPVLDGAADEPVIQDDQPVIVAPDVALSVPTGSLDMPEISAQPDAGATQWQKMLEPYLSNTVPAASQAGVQDPLMPPLLPLSEGTVRVGVLLPLSGKNAILGRAMLNAAQMAMFDFADTDFELLPHDTAGSPEQASYGATMIIGDGASLVAGPLLSSSVRAVAPISRAAGVPVLAFSSDRTVAGKGVYTMGFLPENNTQRVVSYAISQGLSRFVILAPDNAYGAAVVSAARETIVGYGRSLLDVVFYNSSGGDIENVVRRIADYDERRAALLNMRKELSAQEDELSIKALERLKLLETLGDLPYDALLIADGGERLQNVAAMLPFFDIDSKKIRILGTGQWDVPGIGVEPALVGAWFAAPPDGTRTSFVRRYTDLYGVHPPRLASMAYDALALAAVLARSDKPDPYGPSAIMFERGYSGRDGIFRFTEAGTTDRGLAVYEVRRRENIVIEEAPKTFAAAIN